MVGIVLTLIALALALMARDVHLPADFEAAPLTGFLLLWLSFLLPGTLLAVKRPHNPVGWILIGIAIAWQVNSLGGLARVVALRDSTGAPPLWAAWVWDVLWIPPIAMVPLLFLVFPDGRLPSSRWRWVLYALVGSAVLQALSLGLRPGPFTNTPVTNPIGVTALGPALDVLWSVSSVVGVATVLASCTAPVVRYRAAPLTERYQLKWFLAAATVVVAAWVLASLLEAAGVDAHVLASVRTMPLVALPVATAIAVLRHRLYDIDLVLNRGLVYASLAALIAGIYLAVVIGIGALAGRGQTGSMLPLAATAVAAIAFQPARERLQLLANLAVYGRPVSAYDVLSGFTPRVSGAQVGGDAPAAMAATVGEALRVASCDVWVIAGRSLQLAASWPQARHNVPPIDVQERDPNLSLPHADRTYPVRHDGRLLGAIAIRQLPGVPLQASEDRLLVDLATAAWPMLENAQLIAELRASRQRLVEAQDSQRRRIERDLHDGAQHRLLELALTLRLARDQSNRQRNDDLTVTLVAAEQQLRAALAELRDLARGIHPSILTERGLPAALLSLADRAPLTVTVDANGVGRLPATIETTIYFVASEALTNVIKHAGASTADISLARCGDIVVLQVDDNGAGGADASGPGLSGLADRVAAIGGFVTVTSPLGAGTRLRVEVPCG